MRDVAGEVGKEGNRQIGRKLGGHVLGRNADGMCYRRNSIHLQW